MMMRVHLGDCSQEIERCLLLGRKAMTNLDSIFKSRDITLPKIADPIGNDVNIKKLIEQNAKDIS